MRGFSRFFCCLALVLLLAGCGAPPAPQTPDAPLAEFTDALGHTVQVPGCERVVSLYGSFAETWLLAGGELAGTTIDAIEERGLPLGGEAAIIGSVKQPDLEAILALDPDFVILSADTDNQVALDEALTAAGVPHGYFRVDSFDDYLAMLRLFTGMTGRNDLYETNGLAVQAEIQAILEKTAGQQGPSVLLLRAFSTGVKAKGADNLAGVILRDLGADNLVERHESLLEDLSLEEIIAADPDYIFVVPMGDEASAKAYMAGSLEQNPAWAALSAVRGGRYIFLPKELYHYKPNARWGESYRLLAETLYPELFHA